MILLIIILILLVCYLCYKLATFKKSNKITDDYNNHLYKEREEILRTNKLLESTYDTKIASLRRELEQLEEFKKTNETNIDEYFNLYKEKAQADIDDWIKSAQECAMMVYDEFAQDYEVLKVQKRNELDKISQELEDYKVKRDTINQAILRQKQIEEQKDFYRILITEKDIQDIKLLEDIRPKFEHKEILSKLIFDCYIKRPLQEMEKRVLQDKKISGIYKITYVPTGEAYIGRSQDIKNRWVEHVKSSLNIGTIAHSTFHNVLAQNGLENFTWEVLETAPKEKLNEAEKYWINFYETNKYGYNQKAGG